MIGSDIASVLPEMQAQALSLMVDGCTINGPSTHGVADETTGVRTTVAGALRYTGVCRVRHPVAQVAAETRAEDPVQVARYIITIPVDADSVYPGDVVAVTASADAQLLAGTFTVVEAVEASYRYQRSLSCTRDT